jgi:hypothetical protein
MNRFRFFLGLGLVLLTSFAFADNFTIAKFEGEEIGAPDDYIAAEFNDELKKANPNAIQDGRFYVRQKFEDPFDDAATAYGLYQGKLTTAGKAKLGKFSIADKPYSDVLKTKFYLTISAKPDQDIDRVYFDGKFAYVEGESPVFVSIDGKMVELKPSIERVSYFNVTSQPAGAEITLNDEAKGRTPSKITALGTRAVVITLAKPGFYTKIRVLKPQPGLTVDVGELLTEKKDIENPAQALKLKFLELSKKNDSKGLQSLRSSVQSQMDEWPKESGALIQKQMALFPQSPAQGADEGAPEYQNRTGVWQKERDTEQARQQTVADKATEDFRSLLKQIDEALEGTLFDLKHVYIPSTSIQLGRFNKAKKTFELSVKHTAPEVSFTYTASFDLGSLDQGQLVQRKDQIQAVLRVWALPNDAGKTPVFQSVAFYLDQTPLVLSSPGIYASSDATPALIAKGADFDARLAKMTGPARNEFDANVQSKTKALLITFVVTPPPAPIPVVAPVVAPKPIAPPPPVAMPKPAPAPAAVSEEPAEEEEAPATTPAVEADATETPDVAEEADSEEADREESAEAATEDIDAKFGRSDEYRKWGAWGLVAAAVAAGAGAALQHMGFADSKKAYDATATQIKEHKNMIIARCTSDSDPATCERAMTLASQRQIDDIDGPLYTLEPLLAKNKTVMDSYSTGRTLMLLLTASCIGGSIVLFTW